MEINTNDFLIEGPIKTELISKLIDEARSGKVGAESIFLGQVRNDIIEGKKVLEIEYSAYATMVQTEMSKILTIISVKYKDVQRVYVKHSIGKVKAGEFSLFVFVASGHRRQSFKAVEDIVDLIKENLPVWKKEILEDNTHVWTENEH